MLNSTSTQLSSSHRRLFIVCRSFRRGNTHLVLSSRPVARSSRKRAELLGHFRRPFLRTNLSSPYTDNLAQTTRRERELGEKCFSEPTQCALRGTLRQYQQLASSQSFLPFCIYNGFSLAPTTSKSKYSRSILDTKHPTRIKLPSPSPRHAL